MSAATGVVIVNFNAGEALSRCVESVLSQGEAVCVVVVDNASTDGSAETVQAQYGNIEHVDVIFNPDNRGFARAVNQAAAQESLHATAYLLILNPDCELFPGALRDLRDALEGDGTAGLAGPLVVDRGGEALRGTYRRFPDPWRSCMTFTGLWRLGRILPAFRGVEPVAGLPAVTTQAEATSGACMLLPRPVFIEAGGLDEGYGLHCEDLDLMYRLHQRGKYCLFVPGARVYHQQGVSSASRPVWVHWQKHRGMQRFFNTFQAQRYLLPVRWLVVAAIWVRFVLTLPLVLFRR